MKTFVGGLVVALCVVIAFQTAVHGSSSELRDPVVVGCYVPFHSSDSNSFSDLILDSVTCHHYYASRIFSLSFLITFLLYLFTLVSNRKPDIGL